MSDVAYRVSRYLKLTTTQFARPGSDHPVRIAWSTRSGKALPVSLQDARSLELGDHSPTAYGALQSLVDAEILVHEAEDEFAAVIARLRAGAAGSNYREFTLLPTAACNMGCSYCGQTHAKGDIGDDRRGLMQRRVLAAIRDPGVTHVSVRWFGGEPLLAYKHLIAMGTEQVAAVRDRGDVQYDARVVTNGALLTLDRMRELVLAAGIDQLSITLDGPKSVHDGSRRTKSGKPTYERIMALLQAALLEPELSSLRFLLRTNVTRDSAPYVAPYLRDCVARGLAHRNISFELAPVHSWSNGADSVGLNADEYAKAEAPWLLFMAENGLGFPSVPSSARSTTCVAVKRGAEILSATGAVFSCTEKPLVATAESSEVLIKLEELGSHDLRPLGPYDDWHEALEQDETPCSQCEFLGVCGGSCPKLWRESGPPCPSYKRNWETRLEALALKSGFIVSRTGE